MGVRRSFLAGVTLYLTCSICVEGVNVAKLQHVGAMLQAIRGDWIVLGDWNVAPDELLRGALGPIAPLVFSRALTASGSLAWAW